MLPAHDVTQPLRPGAKGTGLCGPQENCGKHFAQVRDLTRHLPVPTRDTPCVCPHEVCGRGFAQPGLLRAHRRTHRRENTLAFRQEGCTKRFVQRSGLHRHLASHQGHRVLQGRKLRQLDTAESRRVPSLFSWHQDCGSSPSCRAGLPGPGLPPGASPGVEPDCLDQPAASTWPCLGMAPLAGAHQSPLWAGLGPAAPRPPGYTARHGVTALRLARHAAQHASIALRMSRYAAQHGVMALRLARDSIQSGTVAFRASCKPTRQSQAGPRAPGHGGHAGGPAQAFACVPGRAGRRGQAVSHPPVQAGVALPSVSLPRRRVHPRPGVARPAALPARRLPAPHRQDGLMSVLQPLRSAGSPFDLAVAVPTGESDFEQDGR
ncbi:MAG: C2H2-type zinc finger protein [Kistimonas sp.]|nr:C2H2-type zinc finger protein [Kistimonas sp.]